MSIRVNASSAPSGSSNARMRGSVERSGSLPPVPPEVGTACANGGRRIDHVDLLPRVLADVEAYAAGCPQSDDMTLLALRYAGTETA